MFISTIFASYALIIAGGRLGNDIVITPYYTKETCEFIRKKHDYSKCIPDQYSAEDEMAKESGQ